MQKIIDFDKVKNYECGNNTDLSAEEKELIVRVNQKDKYISIHSDYRSTNKYIKNAIKNGLGKLKHCYVDNNKIVSITAEIDKGLLTLKSKPRKNKNISSLVSDLPTGD